MGGAPSRQQNNWVVSQRPHSTGARHKFTDYNEDFEPEDENFEAEDENFELDTENFEAKWMKKIPDWALCNWFYMFFLANVVVAAMIVFSLVYVLFTKKGLNHLTPTTIFLAVLQLSVAGTNALFYYIICDRSLRRRPGKAVVRK